MNLLHDSCSTIIWISIGSTNFHTFFLKRPSISHRIYNDDLRCVCNWRRSQSLARDVSISHSRGAGTATAVLDIWCRKLEGGVMRVCLQQCCSSTLRDASGELNGTTIPVLLVAVVVQSRCNFRWCTLCTLPWVRKRLLLRHQEGQSVLTASEPHRMYHYSLVSVCRDPNF